MRWLFVFMSVFSTACLADLRPDGTDLAASSATQARTLLTDMAQAHGGAKAWRALPTVHATMRDV